MFPSCARVALAALLALLITSLASPAPRSIAMVVAHAVTLKPMSCQRDLTLVLRPAPVPPINAEWNGPPARDMPPGPVVERFPFYPGAIPSAAAMPAHVVLGLLPSYRKVAQAEFEVPIGYSTVLAWYRGALTACRMPIEGEWPLQQHGGPQFAALDSISPDWLKRLTLIFRPLSPTSTAILYVAQALDLPPRPASSLLHGPFTRVAVDYRVTTVDPQYNRRYRFTITWPATIARLVATINAPTRIWVPVGVGGAIVSSQSVRLSFVRSGGGARTVAVGGVQDRLIVGRSRPLVDLNGRVLKLLTRIVQHRCPAAGAC